jgi:Flp pilus assembly pilin Flp
MMNLSTDFQVSRSFGSGKEADRMSLSVAKPTSGPKEGFMLALWTKLASRVRDEKGASMVEYALLVVLIAIIAIVAITFAGQQVSQTFSDIGSALANP